MDDASGNPPPFGAGVAARVEGDLATLTLRSLRLTAEAAAELSRAVDWACGQTQVRVVLLAGARAGFCAGAGMPLPRDESIVPALSEAFRKIELAEKPVIAALHGQAVGEGLELALAAHYRIALADAQLSLPQITWGLLPGAGGTQRLPRLVGAAPALELMLRGKPISGAAAAELGLVDHVADRRLGDAAITFVHGLVTENLGPRPTLARREHLEAGAAYLQEVAGRRALPGMTSGAAGRIVDCVEAALILPPAAGLGFEAVAFADCLESPTSQALRAVALAEHRAARFPELTGHPPAIERAGVIGGGTRGAGIAAALLAADHPVTLIEKDDAVEAASARVRAIFDRAVARRQMPAERVETLMRALSVVPEFERLEGCDVVIEAVLDVVTVKIEVLEQAAAAAPEAVLATTTTGLDIAALGRGVGRPEALIGLNLFDPPHVVRVAEIAVPEGASPQAVATVHALVTRLRKVPVRCAAAPGFIGATVQAAYLAAVDHLLLAGAGVSGIDAAMRAWGFRHGPLQFADLVGLAALPVEGTSVAAILADRGRRGRGLGGGFYSYSDAGQPEDDAEVAQIIATERALRGIEARDVSASEIRRRCLSAMANAGAGLVARGVAARPSDIDVVMVHAFAFPKARGGPMHAADTLGPRALQTELAQFAEDGEIWAPSELIEELVRTGRRFADLNAEAG